MESQPQNPEFRINPESFHPCTPQEFVKWINSNFKVTYTFVKSE